VGDALDITGAGRDHIDREGFSSATDFSPQSASPLLLYLPRYDV